MSWAKLDDDFYDHPKVLRAGLEAVGLFAKSLSYSSRKLTNGTLTSDVVEMLARVSNWRDLAERLVDAGLYERDGDGYVIHDYLRFNPSKQHVQKKRRAAVQRMQRSRNVRANTSRSSREVRPKFAVPVPDPTRPDPLEEEPLLPTVVVGVPPAVRPVKDSDSRTHKVRTHFAAKYREAMGHEYVAQYGRDGKHLKGIPESYTAVRLCELVDVFFTSADEFSRTKAGLTIPEFVRKLPALQAQESSSGSWEADAINRAAAEAERRWHAGEVG